MMKIFNNLLILFFTLLLVSVTFGQQKSISEIEPHKNELVNLQQQLWDIDKRERQQVEILTKKSLVKGEFETTKQFEERQRKSDEEIWAIQLRILHKKGEDRESIQRRINEILALEFAGETQIELSKYDADNLRYTIFSKDGIAFNYLMIPINEAKSLKENFSKVTVNGISSLLLDNENRAKEQLLSVKINFEGKTYSVSSQNLTESKAMQMFFGNYNFQTKTSVWKTYKSEYDFDGENSKERIVLAQLTAKPILFKHYIESGVEKYFLVTNRVGINEDEELEISCHACSGLVSVATFVKKSGYWKVETAQKHGGEVGKYGSPGELSLIKIGQEKYAVKVSWGDFHMGYGATREDFWAIQDGIIKEILTILTSEDNSESGEPIKERLVYNSKVTFIQGANPDYYDAKISTTGKKAVKVGSKYVIKPFTKSGTYTFVSGKYELVN